MLDFQWVTKGQKFTKKNLGRSHHRIFIKTFYTPDTLSRLNSYASETADRIQAATVRMCQTVAQAHNLLKINHLHRLPKQVTLYNICNYLKINTLHNII